MIFKVIYDVICLEIALVELALDEDACDGDLYCRQLTLTLVI